MNEFTRTVNTALSIGYSHSTEPYDGLYHWLIRRHIMVDPNHQRRVQAQLRTLPVNEKAVATATDGDASQIIESGLPEAAGSPREIPHAETEPAAAQDNSARQTDNRIL
ncbi:hypothetical protein [Nocardia pneumoniae]|uniref:hypothetical protein n=1 Tax=Nocardia pneumoniae TaxID=228601 RepID=UPI0002D5FD4E|nr:hypothetical protein [Nocardia pneumoniae]